MLLFYWFDKCKSTDFLRNHQTIFKLFHRFGEISLYYNLFCNVEVVTIPYQDVCNHRVNIIY